MPCSVQHADHEAAAREMAERMSKTEEGVTKEARTKMPQTQRIKHLWHKDILQPSGKGREKRGSWSEIDRGSQSEKTLDDPSMPPA